MVSSAGATGRGRHGGHRSPRYDCRTLGVSLIARCGGSSAGFVTALGFIISLATASIGSAQSAENVALVINDNSGASQQIGDYYAQKRALPASNVVHIRTATDESIERSGYQATIEQPIVAALTRGGLLDRVLYIVLTKGVPLRITGNDGVNGTVASVDSELTLLYRRATGIAVPTIGRVENPYFAGTRPIGELHRFTRREHDLYLVTRLDAFTVEQAKALVDKAVQPATEGRIVLDQQDKLVNRTGEDWLSAAAKRLEEAGHGDRVVLEGSIRPARDIAPVLGYYSWGSNDPRNRVRNFGMGFVAGSIAAMYVSSDGRTFREPPADWVPADPNDRSKYFAGTPQSLAGDLIREGATGVAGHVAEPYLQSTIRPDILFPAYLAGFNLVEAFYLAMPHLSWQTVVVGDPLCAPFRKQPLKREDIDEGEDQVTTLPALFTKRRIAVLSSLSPGASVRALALLIKGEQLLTRGDRNGGRAALEQAIVDSPRLAGAHLNLALLDEQSGRFDTAAERYQRVLDVQPRNPIALNNLAYHVAVRKGMPAGALRLAEGAVAAAPQNPMFLDTLAWIQHLLGDNAAAVKTMTQALKAPSSSAEIHLHAAVIYAANGVRAVAETELQQAIRLDPSLDRSEEVAGLRTQIGKLAEPR